MSMRTVIDLSPLLETTIPCRTFAALESFSAGAVPVPVDKGEQELAENEAELEAEPELEPEPAPVAASAPETDETLVSKEAADMSTAALTVLARAAAQQPGGERGATALRLGRVQ